MTRVEFDCEFCGKHVCKSQSKGMQHRFCSRACKSEWQRTQKPVDCDWLYQKYIVEGLDCTQIARLVGRNPKRVWEWLRDYGIPTKGRGQNPAVHFKKGQPSAFRGHKHTPENREAVRRARLKDGHVPYLKNGVHHLKGKKGAETPNWKGGVTPERQAVYGSPEWKAAVKAVWKRDNATCQRCGLHRSQARKEDVDFDIHHIVSFAVAELRCNPDNLVLLCEPCHYWVHSSENVNKEFLK